MGPISNIGPKTSRAARDRPELNLEVKFRAAANCVAHKLAQGCRPTSNHRSAQRATSMQRPAMMGATTCAKSTAAGRPLLGLPVQPVRKSFTAMRGQRAHMRAVEGRGPPHTAEADGHRNFFFIQSEKQRLDAIMATIVSKDPSLGSDTTVGAFRQLPCWRFVPGSNRNYKKTGSSRPDEISMDGFSSKGWPEQILAREAAAAATSGGRA
ncbi:hypothetical protein F511_29171 [Dorcoceras hygrometricum]|uniref:Uncharacterized protein n=1 Tax=Dorcoceras hygrometricum TaxID=472368 RepID=A0A2Z7CZ65_9LAMI|nr:hypothetical protein F511_29171 [Dorcoceras hygrometricum]